MSQYTTKIIKAGALLDDTKVLLAEWDPERSTRENLDQALAENWLGKSSRSRTEHVICEVEERYFRDVEVGNSLVSLVKAGWPAEDLDSLLYYFTARADPLLYDFVVDGLLSQYRSGLSEVDTRSAMDVLSGWIEEGKTTSAWGEYTKKRVARGILSTLRDFGILEGKVNKRITPVYLPIRAFSFLAFYMNTQTGTPGDVLAAESWKLFFLEPEEVERFFVEAQQEGLLRYESSGQVFRIDFPADSLVGYANAFAQRTD